MPASAPPRGSTALPRLGRRAGLFGGLAAAAFPPRGRPAAAAPPSAATFLAPGPLGSPQARWAAHFATALGRATAPQPTELRPAVLGGADGVTAANRFATAAAPDGRTLLALAGAAAHARLIGDSRARYEPSAWLPVCGLVEPTALLVRAAAAAPPVALRRAGGSAAPGPLRLALPGPEAPEAAALLALDLLGIRAEPVFGLSGPAAVQAFAAGRVNAFLARDPALAALGAMLGAELWFAAAPAEAGGGPSRARRDPALPEVPSLAERIALQAAGGAASPAAEAILAADAGLAAVRLGFTIVLPALTPADMVALWRHAAARLGAELEDDDAGAPASRGLLLGTEAAAAYAALCAVPEPVVQTYRGWLARRLNWRSGG
ncbi:hypothetical protein [Caldovatus aquaticus]|uniref:Uncharacterized protein n=1 Tax=Caldovatus aquaticus TaxID=2865671 RepID=A0ABS7F490_9PROT|nr:hypothetical protein [Caldovatus aquaticus]MBW8270435.1 hypothetical protein [Caldovatus aquaticus]